MKKILVFENSHSLTNHLVKLWVKLAKESINKRKYFTVAVTGGRSPLEFYSRLSEVRDFSLWSRTHIFITDEWYVSPNHKHSNFRLISESLLSYVDIPYKNIHPIKTEKTSIIFSAKQYEQELCSFFKLQEDGLPEFDFILLGLGTDGHIASLFHGESEEEVENGRGLTTIVSYPHIQYKRVTLTMPVINNAKNVVFIITGTLKAKIFEEILVDKSNSSSTTYLGSIKGNLIYMIDSVVGKNIIAQRDFNDMGNYIEVIL